MLTRVHRTIVHNIWSFCLWLAVFNIKVVTRLSSVSNQKRHTHTHTQVERKNETDTRETYVCTRGCKKGAKTNKTRANPC